MVEIDGICEKLESRANEAGNLISDEYYRLIDLVTGGSLNFDASRLNGDRPNFDRACRVAVCIRNLNRNLGTTAAYLGSTGLHDVYNDVIEQVNEMVEGVEGMHKLHPIEPDSAKCASIAGRFRS